MHRIVESYKRKLASEDGWVLKRGAQLRIALCYPNVYSIGMANLGFQAMYELFNNIPDVSCERVFLPDSRATRGSSPTVREGVKRSGEDLPYARATRTEFSRNFPAHWDPKLRIPRGQVVAAASIVSPKY